MSDVLKGAKAAAEATGLTPREIFYLVERQYVPFRRIGRQLYFSRAALLTPLRPEHALTSGTAAVGSDDATL